MPARSTVVSSISKRADQGHRSLSASEFLQMSGRAGRRGMDEVGHVVVLHHPFESVEEAAKLAVQGADPLSSRFTPSYGMVLNLLERHSTDEAKDLIERSFGQFMVNQMLAPLYSEQAAAALELQRLEKPLCPGELGDLPLYAKRLEAIRTRHKQLKQMEKAKPQLDQIILGQTRDEIKSMLAEAYAMPCHGCPVQKPCSKQADRIRHLTKRIKEINRRIEREANKHWRMFQALADILRVQGYLDGGKPTHLGKLAIGIRGNNELFLTEVAVSGILERLKPSELAAVLSCLVTEEGRAQENGRLTTSAAVDDALGEIRSIARKIFLIQRQMEVDMSIDLSPTFAALTQAWAEGASWDQMRLMSLSDEGDIVRTLRRTLDLCRQFVRAPGMPPKVVAVCSATETLIARDEVNEDF